MKRLVRSVVGVFLACSLVACSSLEVTTPPLQVIEEITFHPSLDVDLTDFEEQSSGIWIQDVEEGEGDVAAVETTVEVSFAGWVATTGQQFVRDVAPIILGVGEIPAGLDEAIQGMRPGGERRAVVPPLLGYGRFPNGLVPGGSVLVYDIELIQVLTPPS